MYDLIIIGGGMSGYTSAIYAVRYKLKTLVLEKSSGGIILDTPIVQNFPGFKSISGKELMQKVKEQAKELGAEIETGEAQKVEKKKDEFLVKTEEKSYSARSVIIASGTERRKLGIPGEDEFTGRGVSFCATCDAAFFKNKTVAIIGGGNSAFRTAQKLLQYVKRLYIMDAGKEVIAEPAIVEQIKKDERVTIMSSTSVKEIKGKGVVKAVITAKGEDIAVDGIFIDIGYVPSKELSAKIGLKTDKNGYIEVDAAMKTNVEGIFAAGDITNSLNNFKQLTSAAASGAIAANSAFNYIKSLK